MDKSHFIGRAKEMLGKDLNDESIAYYLKEEGINPSSIASIIEIARLEFVEEQARKFTKQNKFSYYLWVTLASAILIFMLFVFPYFQIVVGRIFIFSLLGAVFCCICGFMAFSYYKTWNENYVCKIGRPKIQYAFLIILWIPGLILHYVFSFRFSSVQDNELKQTQVEVIGHVTGGNSTQVKKLIGGSQMADISNIVVEFETEDGQKMVVSKNVDADEFKNFYKGEEIHIIYSKNNPHNIDLLDNASSIRNFKNTQERELEAVDLMHLVVVSPPNLGEELNKISYGWHFDPGREIWVNEKRECAISLNGNKLNFIGKYDYNVTYPIYLTQNGYKMTNKEDPDDIFHTGKKTFENKQFIFNVEARGMPDSAHSIISVIRK
jgi:hypothetical protein